MPGRRGDRIGVGPACLLLAGLAVAPSHASAALGTDGAFPADSIEAPCRRHHRAGIEFLQRRRYADARESLELAVDACPREAGAWRDLGSACLALGEPRVAAERFRRALALRPADVEAELGLASACAVRAGEDRASADSALAACARILRADPGCIAAYRLSARVYEVLGDLPASIMMDAQSRLAAASGDTVETSADLGRKLLSARVYSEAFRVYRERVAADSSDTPSLRIVAYLDYRLNRPDRAANAYETILRREPRSSTALRESKLLAECLRQSGRLEASARRWEEVVAAEPEVARNHAELAAAWFDAGRFEAALAAADRAVSTHGDWGCLWFARGEALAALAEREENAGSLDLARTRLREGAESFRRAANDATCGEKARRRMEQLAVRGDRIDLRGESGRER